MVSRVIGGNNQIKNKLQRFRHLLPSPIIQSNHSLGRTSSDADECHWKEWLRWMTGDCQQNNLRLIPRANLTTKLLSTNHNQTLRRTSSDVDECHGKVWLYWMTGVCQQNHIDLEQIRHTNKINVLTKIHRSTSIICQEGFYTSNITIP